MAGFFSLSSLEDHHLTSGGGGAGREARRGRARPPTTKSCPAALPPQPGNTGNAAVRGGKRGWPGRPNATRLGKCNTIRRRPGPVHATHGPPEVGSAQPAQPPGKRPTGARAPIRYAIRSRTPTRCPGRDGGSNTTKPRPTIRQGKLAQIVKNLFKKKI